MNYRGRASRGIRCVATLLVLAAAWQWCVPPVAYADEHHVSSSYGLKVALAEAASNGVDDTIYLAAGVYSGGFVVVPVDGQTLTVRGDLGTGAQDVVLDGGGERRVLGMEGSMTGAVRLVGLTIQHGRSSNQGGGIFVRTWADSRLSLELRDSVLRFNEAGKHGGALKVDTMDGNSRIDLSLINTLVYGNEARWSGGGIDVAASEVGANNQTTAFLSHCTITGNTADAESTDGHQGGGVSVVASRGATSQASLTMYNTIVHGNFKGNESAQDLAVDQYGQGTAEVEARYCNIGGVQDPLGLYTPLHVIDSDPSFVDPEGDDYHLSPDSPCVDAGTASVPIPPGLPNRDFEGGPRLIGLAPDIGADEAALALYLPVVM